MAMKKSQNLKREKSQIRREIKIKMQLYIFTNKFAKTANLN